MSGSGHYKQANPVKFPSRIIMRGVRAWLLVEDNLQAATRRKVAKSARTKRHHTSIKPQKVLMGYGVRTMLLNRKIIVVI